MTETTVLAVTRLGDGVCVAGVDGDGKWVRATRPSPSGWRQLEYSDCKDRSGVWVVRKGNVVAMDLVKPIQLGAHTEDWLVGDNRPRLVKQLADDEYREVCRKLQENSTASIEGPNAIRSLMVVRPDKITSFSFNIDVKWERQRRYTPRCAFRLGGRPYQRVAISDAEWRGYGRSQRKRHNGDCQLSAREILDEVGMEDCWLTLGRNDIGSTVYLMVVGVHLFPPRRFEMDFLR